MLITKLSTDMKKLRKYSIGASSEVTAISLVDEPAVESKLVYFKNQKPLFLETDEKKMVYSCVLRPDFEIYRRYGEQEFYVEFSKECIERLALQYMKDYHQSDWTTDHQTSVEGLTVVESWIKSDMEKDKSVVLGLDKDLPVGTWFVGCKVENDETWSRIKNGDFGGFSIEAFVNLEEINLEKHMNSNFENIEINDSFWDKIKSIIVDALKEPEVEEVKAEEEATEQVEELKEEVVETPTEEVVEEVEMETENVEEVPVETPTEEIVNEVVEVVEETSEEPEVDLQSIIDGLKEEIDALNSELEELKKENVKLSKQPSAKPISTKLGKTNGSNFDKVLSIMNGTAFKN